MTKSPNDGYLRTYPTRSVTHVCKCMFISHTVTSKGGTVRE